MSGTQAQFVAKVNELIRTAQALPPAAARQVLEMLDAARKQILAQLVDLDPASFTAAQLRQLKTSIDQAMQDFAAKATAAVTRLQGDAASVGSATAQAPLAAVGLEGLQLGRVDQSTLAIAQGYTADLITGLSQDAAAKINGALQRAFLGGQSITDIIAQIGRGLSKDGSFSGIFGPIGDRAVTIATNEILRVHSIAQQSRLEDLVARHPDLQKQWFHINAALRPRAAHIYASGQVVDVDQPFEVGGEELMYPRDPNGSPENTINCHCVMRPYFADSALKPTGEDKSLLEKLGIAIEQVAA